MHGLYMVLLLISLAGLNVIDRRYQLVLYRNKRLAGKVMAICVLGFVVWDIAGIALNIFYIGNSRLLLGLGIGNFPVEELFFLLLLNYTALVLSQYLKLRRGLS